MSLLHFGSLLRKFSSTTVKERLQKDMIAAFKSKDSARTTLLRQLQAELVNFEKSKSASNGPIAEADMIGVLRGCSEKWAKAIEEYKKIAKENPFRAGDIGKIIEKEMAELQVISSYLPPPYSADELVTAIRKAIEELGPDNAKVGPLVKSLMQSLDPTRISRKDLAAAVQTHLTSIKPVVE